MDQLIISNHSLSVQMEWEVDNKYHLHMSEYSGYFYNSNKDDIFSSENEDLSLSNHAFSTPQHDQKPDEQKQTIYPEELKETFSSNKRPYAIIELEEETIRSYIRTGRGQPSETMSLHPNFKSITSQFLRQLCMLKIVTPMEISRIKTFLSDSPSFSSFQSLSGFEGITLRKNLLSFFGSTSTVRRILSSRVSLNQKRMMLKYLEKLRESILNGEVKGRWKRI